MNIFITGGLGFVGNHLIDYLKNHNHTITVIQRNLKNKKVPKGIKVIEADASQPGPWQDKVAQNDLIINLAGVSIFTRWTKSKKRAIYESRIKITKNIVDAISKNNKKITLLNTSAVGYYGFHDDEKLSEDTGPGNDFLARVCVDWEKEALRAEEFGSRVALMRFGVVLGKNGGAMEMFKTIYKLRLGSRLGPGKQWFSWIHIDDLISAIQFLMDNANISGPVNFTSPNVVTNKELTKSLNKALGTWSPFPPVPSLALKLVMGEFGSFLLKGQRAMPEKLLKNGYTFSYEMLKDAIKSLL